MLEDIPSFLRISSEERANNWKGYVPPVNVATEVDRQLELRAAQKEEKRLQAKQAYEKRKRVKANAAGQAAAPKIDHSEMRWDPRYSRFVPDKWRPT